jgi:rhodanese-related sulfurtransferase
VTGVFTPTVVAFRYGEEVARHVCAGSAHDVERVFQAAAGVPPQARSISRTDRTILAATGVALAVVGMMAGAWWLVAPGGSFLLGGWYDLVSNRGHGSPKTVDANQAAKRMQRDDVVVVDVRTAAEVAQGAIQGATHLDVAHRGFGEKVARLDPSREYFLYCRTGSRSARALRVFRRAGIDRSTHLTGGIRAWTKAGLPVKKGDNVT